MKPWNDRAPLTSPKPANQYRAVPILPPTAVLPLALLVTRWHRETARSAESRVYHGGEAGRREDAAAYARWRSAMVLLLAQGERLQYVTRIPKV